MNTILSLSPTDNRCFSAEIASALEDINAAVIIQQLHYWMGKENVGVVIDGVRWIYNTFADWITQQFKWLTSWQFRKSMTLLRTLGIVKVIRYKARQWNQTNYYTLDYDRLFEFLKSRSPQSTETAELCVTSDRDVETQTLDLRDTNISLYDSKNTIQKETAEQDFVAASNKSSFFRGSNGKEDKSSHQGELNPLKEDLKQESTGNKKDIGVDKSSALTETKIKNKNWFSHREELDNLGLQLNSTVLKLIKEYPSQEVERAIAFVKIRKRDKYIENPTGYFVQALKENWGGETNIAANEQDKFRYWYSLAKELGHVTGSEIRDGEQWVCFTGTWSRYQNVVERGHTVDYLKTVINRYRNR